MTDPGLGQLIRRLQALAALPPVGEAALASLRYRYADVSAGDDIYEPGSRSLPCYVVVEGSLCRYKRRGDGIRANVSFELPGDILDIESLLLDTMDCGARAISDGRLAVIDRDDFTTAWRSAHELESALWRYCSVKTAALEEWLLNIGRRSPTARVAHVLCELHARLLIIGAPREQAFRIHVVPAEIANAMGIAEVHVVRVLHEFRLQRILETEGGVIILLDIGRLAQIGDFNPAYLHSAA